MLRVVFASLLFGAIASSAVAEDKPAGSVVVDKNGNIKIDGSGGGVDLNLGDAADDVDIAVKDAAGDVTVAKKGTLEINGSSKKLTAKCEPKTTVKINGSAHVITLTGECARIELSGSSNTVTAEAVGFIEVSGANNSIVYKSGLKKDVKPKIKTSGVGNKVSKLES